MKKRIAKVLCAAVLGGSLAVTAFPGVAMAAEKEGGFKVAYITRNQSDPFAAELVNQFTSQAEEYADTFTLDTFDSQADSEKENSIIEDCITKKYDCIIVQPNDGNLQQPYCQKVLDAGIFCMLTTADLLGNGAYEAVKDDDTYDGMLVYSVDCLAKTVLEIKDGVYTAAVYQNPPALAAANLKAAYDLLTGAETVVNTSVDSLLCTSDNVDQFIQMYIDQGQITEDEAKSHGYEAGSATSILDDSESEKTTEEATDDSTEEAEKEAE